MAVLQVLLEGEGHQQQSVAVRLALGETQLVAETKQFLVENGIHLDAFQDVIIINFNVYEIEL